MAAAYREKEGGLVTFSDEGASGVVGAASSVVLRPGGVYGEVYQSDGVSVVCLDGGEGVGVVR